MRRLLEGLRDGRYHVRYPLEDFLFDQDSVPGCRKRARSMPPVPTLHRSSILDEGDGSHGNNYRLTVLGSNERGPISAGNYYNRYYKSQRLDLAAWTTWTGAPAQEDAADRRSIDRQRSTPS
jgi:hypothetical protein